MTRRRPTNANYRLPSRPVSACGPERERESGRYDAEPVAEAIQFLRRRSNSLQVNNDRPNKLLTVHTALAAPRVVN